MSAPLVAVAEYVRMSTEDQQYSIANQKTEIRRYATKHGFVVGHTYTDAGKSGVVIKHRTGLAALIRDVVSGKAEFKAILVYDVSRWGRFQNPDEAAHYEYLCNEAGIRVHYCAEQFANDGSLPSSMMKAMKRTMASEYSRELGVKVYEGKKRLTELGFSQGGPELYGLRRMVVSVDGRRKHLLKAGERKGILTDRVILVPGNHHQVAIVREIFESAFKKKSLRLIAANLNARRVKSLSGRPWSGGTVYKILKNPTYMGCAIWGRSSCRLYGVSKRLPKSQWIKKAGAFAPIVDEATFERAQRVIEGRNRLHPKSDEEIVATLKRVLARKGTLSGAIIKGSRGMLGPSALYIRFGSFLRLCELVGHVPPVQKVKMLVSRHCNLSLRKKVFEDLSKLSPEWKVVRPAKSRREILEIGQGRFVSIYICRYSLSQGGNARWSFKIAAEESKNIALICCLDTRGEVLSYHLVPALGQQSRGTRALRENDPWLEKGIKINRLVDVYQRLSDPETFNYFNRGSASPTLPLVS